MTAKRTRSIDDAFRVEHMLANTGFDAEPIVVGARYVLLRKIGSGSYGTVYAARDTQLDRRVAIKILDLGDPDLSRREAKALAELDHPNVVTVHDHGQGEDYCYVVLQLLDGPSLREWCSAQRRRTSQLVATFTQAGRGLAAAHAKGLVHRDFKPSNVRLGPDGQAVVVDFGLARHHDTLEQDLEARGALQGTRAYLAPERLAGQVGDARADQFSFCVAMWECLSGANPFGPCEADPMPTQRYHAIVAGVQGTCRGPRHVVRALRRGMSFNPAERFPSMDALLQAFEPRRKHRRLGDFAVGGFVTLSFAALIVRVVPSGEGEGSSGVVQGVLTELAGDRAVVLAQAGDGLGAIRILERVLSDDLDPARALTLALASQEVALAAEEHSAHVDAVRAWGLAVQFARLAGDRGLERVAHDRLYFLSTTVLRR